VEQNELKNVPIDDEEEENTIETEKDSAESDNEKAQDQLLRLQAEFINYKKRVEQQRAEWYDQATRDLLLKLLPILDDFDHLFMHTDEHAETIPLSGVKLIYDKFLNILQEIGLEQVDAEKNKFDPELHDAVHVQHHPETPDGHVIEVWQKGYKFKDKLLRPAKVNVAETKE